MILLLDTSVLIDTLRARQNRRVFLAELLPAGHQLSTSAINIAESHVGMRDTEREETEAFLGRLQCYPLTATVARRAGSLKNTYARRGITLALPDMLVAATALEHNLALVTDNRKDFPLPDLKLYDLP